MLRALAISTKNTTYLFDTDGYVVRQPRQAGSDNYTGMTTGERYLVVRRPDEPSATYNVGDLDSPYGKIKFAVQDCYGECGVLHVETSSVQEWHYMSSLDWAEDNETFFSSFKAQDAARSLIIRQLALHPQRYQLDVNYKGRVTLVTGDWDLENKIRNAFPGLFRGDVEKIIGRILQDVCLVKVELDPYSVEGLAEDDESDGEDALAQLRQKLASN